jgi:hypothetical protein
MAVDAWISVDPKVLAKSLRSTLMDSIALVMKLTSIGVISMACPIEIAKGVKRSPKIPKGPDLFKSRKSMRPSTTVGIPRKALKDERINRFPRKFFMPKITAIGMLHSAAIAVANPETYRDLKTIV